jgi:hypothetical protein
MRRLLPAILPAVLLTFAGCSMKPASNQQANAPASQTQPASSQPQAATTPATATTTSGELQPGQATGSYTAKGETVELKYAYASRGERFGDPSIIVLVTDKPIPTDSVAEEIKDQTMLLDGKIRGLEYVFSDDGYWVRYHPGQAQTSKSGRTKEYLVENEVIKAADEDDGEAFEGRYKRSVRFVAPIGKE